MGPALCLCGGPETMHQSGHLGLTEQTGLYAQENIQTDYFSRAPPADILDWKSVFFIDYAKAFDCVDHNKLWTILKEMVIPDHLICLLRNLYAGREATVRTGHGTTD